ncbi:hypothetical protein RJ55_08702 [Drechmeria coniospora]|nr:hypothetical protein RJ55_08710 [Drechmeria coniospora]ODA75769.1 hypothetical protein RJ55_08702 [Drechmeria coniospora]
MASHPPAECCAVGTLFAGTPSGESIKIDDGRVEAYVAKATGSRARKGCGILYLPDVIGIWQNSKLIADGFAASGYTTLVVDLFDGDAVPPNPPKGFQFFDWLERGTDGRRPHTAEHVDPIVVKGVKALRELGVDKIAAVGYCFGAKVNNDAKKTPGQTPRVARRG